MAPAILAASQSLCAQVPPKELTPAHDVVAEEGDLEPEGQHQEVGGEPREELGEPRGFAAEVPKGAGHQDPVGVEAEEIIVGGVQLCRLHQLPVGKESKKVSPR